MLILKYLDLKNLGEESAYAQTVDTRPRPGFEAGS